MNLDQLKQEVRLQFRSCTPHRLGWVNEELKANVPNPYNPNTHAHRLFERGGQLAAEYTWNKIMEHTENYAPPEPRAGLTLEQARRLRNGTILFLREHYTDGRGEVVSRIAEATYFKTLGAHVVVQMRGNLMITFFPGELYLVSSDVPK